MSLRPSRGAAVQSSVMRRQLVTQAAESGRLRLGLLLAQGGQLAHQQVDLALLHHDGFVEVVEQVFGEAGLDLQVGETLLGAKLGRIGRWRCTYMIVT